MNKHDVYSLLRFYPIFMIPVGGALIELGFFYRRRKKILVMKMMFGLSAFFFISGLLWFVGRGDLHSDEWARWLLLDYDFGSVAKF